MVLAQQKAFIDNALRSEFYQRKLRQAALQSWEKVPVTHKSELRDADSFSLIGVPMSEIASYHETSGTTGRPTSSWYSHHDIENEARLVVKSALQLTSEDFILNRLTFTVSVASFIILWAAQQAGSGHVSLAKSGISTPVRVLDVMERTSPTVLSEIPFELEILAGVRQRLDRSIPKSLRALLVAGEVISPARKRWLEKLWGVPVFALFGSTETGGLLMTCSKGHYHLNNPNVYIEVLDEYGQAVERDDQGELVISTLRQGMPVLRFANHDRVALKPADFCDCGDPNPVLLHYGRSEDILRIGNRSWSFYEIQELIYTLSYIPMLWKIQNNSSSITLYYQSFDNQSHPEKERLIKREMETTLQVPVQVQFESMMGDDELLSLSSLSKFQYVV